MGKKAEKRKQREDAHQIGEIPDDDLAKLVTMLAVYPHMICIDIRTGEAITEAYESALYAEALRRGLLEQAFAFAQELGAQDAYADIARFAPIEGVQA